MRSSKIINYTESEKSIIDLLKRRRGRPIDTREIMDHYYKDVDKPTFARENLVVTLSTVMRKVALKKENFRIKKSKRRGPHPCEYWVE